MTGSSPDADLPDADVGRADDTRLATVRTSHGTPTRAVRVAAAVRPDNTDEMTTRVDGAVVETTVIRGTTGGLRSTVDDYVTNLRVAQRVVDEATHDPTDDTRTDDTNTDRSDTDDPNTDSADDTDANDTHDTQP